MFFVFVFSYCKYKHVSRPHRIGVGTHPHGEKSVALARPSVIKMLQHSNHHGITHCGRGAVYLDANAKVIAILNLRNHQLHPDLHLQYHINK